MMKRYTRMNPNALCLIPRKAIAWIMLSMAMLTILSLILIEVRRIFTVKDLIKENQHQGTIDFYLTVDGNKLNQSLEVPLDGQDTDQVKISQETKIAWNSDTIEALFEDSPHCLDKPYLLILVTSAPENFERREAIRRSWADAEIFKLQVSGLKSKTLFLVGKSSTKFLNILLKNENDITGDILIGNYYDNYRNLTMKVMNGFKWALRHCKSTYLLKTDDDCFVNVPILLQFLWKHNPVPMNLYAGKVRWSTPVIRDPNSRWYVSNSDYSKQRYAPYAIGVGYILSRDVLKKLVVFSQKLAIFPNEDAYVGTVMNFAGVRPTYSERFVNHPGPWQSCNFLYLFVIHRVKASRQIEYTEMSNRAIEQCSLDEMVKDWV